MPNYDEIARRFGGVSAPPPVDYDALAAAHGAVSGATAAPPTDPEDELIRAAGFDPAVVKKSHLYKTGYFTGLHGHVSTLGKVAEGSVPISMLAGAAGVLGAGIQTGAHLAKAAHVYTDSDVAFVDAARKIAGQSYGEGRGPETLAEKVAGVAGGVLTPLPGGKLAPASKLGRIVVGAARGGLAAAALSPVDAAPSDERAFWIAKAKQAAMGAGVGTGLSTLAEGGAALARRSDTAAAKARQIVSARQLMAEGKRFGVPVRASDFPGQVGLRNADILAEKMPVIGSGRARESQMMQARAAVSRETENLGAPIGNPAETAIANLQGRQKAAKRVASRLYGDRDKLAEGLGAPPVPTVAAAMHAAADELGESVVLRVGDKRLASTLSAIENKITPDVPQASGLFGPTGKPLPAPAPGPEALPSLRSLTTLRSDLGTEITKAQRAGDEKLVRHLVQLKRAAEADMEAFAMQSGRPALATAQKRADSFYRTVVAPYKARVLRQALRPTEGGDVNKTFTSFITNSGTKDAQFLYDRLGARGRAAIQAGIAQDALDAATGHSAAGVETFSPAKFTSALDKRGNAYNVFFQGDEKRTWDGLRHLMAHITRAGQYAENPPTGARNTLIGLASAAGASTYATHGLALLPIIGTHAGTQWLIATRAGQRLLLRAASLEPGSEAMVKLAQQIERLAPKPAGYLAGQATQP